MDMASLVNSVLAGHFFPLVIAFWLARPNAFVKGVLENVKLFFQVVNSGLDLFERIVNYRKNI
jgi:hypothetical protein